MMRVIPDIIINFLVRCIIADDMIIKTFLPNFSTRGLPDLVDIFRCCGFKSCNKGRNRPGRPVGNSWILDYTINCLVFINL